MNTTGNNFTWADFIAPITLSLKVSLLASVVVFALGIAAAWWMTFRAAAMPGRTLLETLFLLPLVLPPSVVGFILLFCIGRQNGLGRLWEAWFGRPLVFTWWAAVLAAIVVAFPLVYQTMKVGFASVDRDLLDSARSAGAGELALFRYMTLPLASRSLGTAYVLGFARGLGEFGATLMVAGNIPGQTQTIPTAIYVAVDSGRMPLAWAWTGTMIVISFVLLLWTGSKRKE